MGKSKNHNKMKYKLMNDTLIRFGMKPISEAELISRFEYAEFGIPIPIIKHKDDITVWLDRDYIAYSSRYEEEVHYVYITVEHIKEEVDQIESPFVKKAFHEALKSFEKTGMDYYIKKMSKSCH